MSRKGFEEEFLLPNNPEISIDDCQDEFPQTKELGYSPTTKESLSHRLWKPVALHTSLILFYSLLFAWGWERLQRNYDTQHNVVFSPYEGQYEAQVFQHKHSVYVGEPSTDLDAAWHKLLRNSNIRVTELEMSQIPGRKEEAIPLPDGGYFASPNVYHNLHCVKRLHHYMYRDHYYFNVTQHEIEALEYHNHHCLDMIRQSLMCQGDMQLLTMKWRTAGRIPTANFTMPHKCVNWDNLETWAADRRIKRLYEPGYLIHPTFGPAYPDGHGDPIGEFLADEG